MLKDRLRLGAGNMEPQRLKETKRHEEELDQKEDSFPPSRQKIHAPFFKAFVNLFLLA
jgi:hypothetical protein